MTTRVALFAATFGLGCSLFTDLDVTGGSDSASDAATEGGFIQDGAPADDARAAADARADADSGTTYRDLVLASHPVAYWRFGEAAGEVIARDETGNGNDGTYAGNLSLGAEGALAGDPNGAVRLEGNGVIMIGDKLDFAGNVKMSIELWVALAAGDPRLVIKPGPNGGYALVFWQNSVRFDHSGDKYCYCIAFESDAGWVKDDRYHHIVATYDTVTMRLYVDAVLAQTSICQASLAAGVEPLDLGRDLVGRLDEVAFYDRVLTAPDIKQHFDARTAR